MYKQLGITDLLEQIKPYNYKDAASIREILLDYRNTLDYRHLFASKEWLLPFLEIYKLEYNFLIKSRNGKNYFSLSKLNNELVFTGDPFNDFNGAFVNDPDDKYDFKNIIQHFSEAGYRIKWTNLFESRFLEELSKNDRLKEGIVGLKILRGENTQDYDNFVSARILRMYDKFSENLVFFRIFGTDINDNPIILRNLLSARRAKLLEKKKEEYNPSFEKEFDKFIIKVVSIPTLWKNVFIDYCVNINTNVVVSSSLNFMKDKNTICYLRAHTPLRNPISYGLILDYWSNSKNFHDGIKIIDLTRGSEHYKYRLGATEYKLNNFVAI